MIRMRSMVVGAAALVIAASVALAGGGVANAAVTPAFEPDPNALGSLTLYNAEGAVITSGSVNDSPFVAYAAASGPGRDGDTRAFLRVATPKAGTPTDQFLSSLLSSSSNYPNPNAPAPINGFTNPVASVPAGAPSLASAIAANPNTETSPDLANIYEIRLVTTAPGRPANVQYYRVDILVDTAAGTWSVVYPEPATTTTTVSASPASPAAHGSTVTLTANVAPTGAAGSVHFFDGSTDLGAGTYDPATGAATLDVQPGDGDHTFRAQFAPADPSQFAGSTSADLPYTVTPPAAATTTTLSASPASPAAHGSTVTLNATVAPTGTAGSVHFFDGTTDLGAGSYDPATGAATLDVQPADGDHTFRAEFTPENLTAFTGSASAELAYTVTPAPPATPTATTLAVVPQTVPHGSPVLFVALTAPIGTPGSVHIFDGTTDLGAAIYIAPLGLSLFVAAPATGDHVYTAHFVPANPAQFAGSTSAPVTVTVQACNACANAL